MSRQAKSIWGCIPDCWCSKIKTSRWRWSFNALKGGVLDVRWSLAVFKITYHLKPELTTRITETSIHRQGLVSWSWCQFCYLNGSLWSCYSVKHSSTLDCLNWAIQAFGNMRAIVQLISFKQGCNQYCILNRTWIAEGGLILDCNHWSIVKCPSTFPCGLYAYCEFVQSDRI